jgi:hypothetical protein
VLVESDEPRCIVGPDGPDVVAQIALARYVTF